MIRSPPKSPKKTVIRAQSMFNNYDDAEMEESLKERDDRIRELEEIIARQDEMMKEMKNQMKPTTEIQENEVEDILEVDTESVES